MGDPFGMVSAGISAATNLAIAQATNASNARNVKDTNATNQAIAAENNATQVSMQRENNQFNHDEAELANQRMIEQWQRETQYNSPIEQVARLQQAGLNPQLAYGGNSVNNVGAASHGAAQASSASSGISPSMPNLIPFQAQMHLPGKDFADIAKALAEAKKTGAEGDLVAKSLEDQLRKMKSDADMADLATTFEQIYGGAFRDQKLQKDIKEVQLLTMQAFNFKKQGDLAAAEEVLTKIKQSTERMDSRLKRYQGDTAKLQSETYLSALQAALDLKSAQTNAANASAKITTEQFNELKHKNDWFKYLDNGKDAEVNPYRSYIFGLLEEAASKNALNDAEVKKIKDLLPHLVDQAESDAAKGKPWTWTYFVDKLCNIAGSTAGNALLLLLQ